VTDFAVYNLSAGQGNQVHAIWADSSEAR